MTEKQEKKIIELFWKEGLAPSEIGRVLKIHPTDVREFVVREWKSDDLSKEWREDHHG